MRRRPAGIRLGVPLLIAGLIVLLAWDFADANARYRDDRSTCLLRPRSAAASAAPRHGRLPRHGLRVYLHLLEV